MPDFSPVLPLTVSAPSSPPHGIAKQTSPNPLLPLYNLAANLASQPIPAKFKKAKPSLRLQRVKSKGEVTHDVTKLQTSFEIIQPLKDLRNRRWTVWDLQHAVTFACLAFCLLITPSAPFLKSAVMGALAVLLLMPVTRQFFLPSLPIWVYLFYFFASRFIAPEYRPHIWVKVLPALENVLYGANLSNILSSHTYTVLDIIAWIPYGLGHFALPLVTSVMLFLFAAPGTTPVWARAFGYMSILGVTIQILFPCTPPWYESLHGLEPAHYGMEGSPAGLKRIDELFGVDMYTTSFTTAPVPFGAFPSLHGGDAVLEALFLQYCFPRFRAFFVGYVIWIAWSTMYLNHHYAIDLVGGGIIAAVTYYIARTRWLPRPQLDKTTRWEYEYVEFGDRPRVALDEEYGGMGLGLLQRRGSDEWTLGSSSSFDSMSRGDTLCGSSSSSPNILSPTTPSDDHHGDLWSKVRTTSPRGLGVGEEEQREVYVR